MIYHRPEGRYGRKIYMRNRIQMGWEEAEWEGYRPCKCCDSAVFLYNQELREEKTMEKIYFTIAGTKHHYGQEYFEPKMEVKLVKEPDNEYDKEAIKVEMDGLGLVGYVANSPYTVQGESMSAGRLYDRIGDTARGIVKYVLPQGVLCELAIAENEGG